MIPECIKFVLNKLEQNGFEAYLVGGFVRDSFFSLDTQDIDIATNAKPCDVLNIFQIVKQSLYGSISFSVNEYKITITTYRKELEYNNYRLSKICYTSNLIQDAKRRDFTINALYMNQKGQVIDPIEAYKDIQKKHLKTIGNPYVRLKEDPLRILRAIRFSTIYHLKMDKELKKAIEKTKKFLKEVSIHKIKKELDFILLNGGFPLLKKMRLLDVLYIKTHKIVYVPDLVCLWAQIKTTIEYPCEKKFKKRKKIIQEQIKCGTINMLSLYQYGFYDMWMVSKIIHFPLKKLLELERTIPIHSRSDIAISVERIKKISNKTGKDLGIFLEELEKNILLFRIKNEEKSIEEFIKEVV